VASAQARSVSAAVFADSMLIPFMATTAAAVASALAVSLPFLSGW
jgi:hypothetical protein